MVRIDEMRESLHILRQVVDAMPPAKPVSQAKYGIAPMTGAPTAVSRISEDIHSACREFIAGSRRQRRISFYIVSDGSIKPYRIKIRSPSFCNLTAIPKMVEGLMIPDLIAAFGTLMLFLAM